MGRKEVIYMIERTEMIREANQRLAHSIRAVGLTGELMLQIARSLPGIDLTALEAENGRTIKYLVQTHLTRYMQGPTSLRGMGGRLGAHAQGDTSDIGAVLDVDSGQLLLYESMGHERIGGTPTEPLPDEEWFRHWRGALAAATTVKAY